MSNSLEVFLYGGAASFWLWFACLGFEVTESAPLRLAMIGTAIIGGITSCSYIYWRKEESNKKNRGTL